MRPLERKISKMQVLNDDAISKLYVAEKLYTSNSLPLETAIEEMSLALKQKALKTPYKDRLNILYDRAVSIKNILDAFDENQFRKFYALKKGNASTRKILEDPLREVEGQ